MGDNKLSAASVLVLLIMIIACNGGKMEKEKVHYKSIKDVPASAWEAFSKKKIFFGHQSVGFNIMEGIEAVILENPKIKLNIVITSDPEKFNQPIFAHTTIGENENPQSKTDAFVNLLDNGIGRKVDMAAYKYCYIDTNSSSDVQKMFRHYQQQNQYLKNKYPDITFIHVTMPLTTIQTGIKAWIKKILGRPVGGIEENRKRNEFNALLLKEYKNKEPVFDLASVEATRPDQQKEKFIVDGKEYLSMFSDYSSDGGHLNRLGSKVVAEQFILALVENMQR